MEHTVRDCDNSELLQRVYGVNTFLISYSNCLIFVASHTVCKLSVLLVKNILKCEVFTSVPYTSSNLDTKAKTHQSTQSKILIHLKKLQHIYTRQESSYKIILKEHTKKLLPF